MYIVINDKEKGASTVYKADIITFDDGYIILASPGWRGFFPLSRFRFMGLAERGLLG